MKIRYEFIQTATLEGFAEDHNLTMVVTERDQSFGARFYARFEGAEIADPPGFLTGVHGNGDYIGAAVDNYMESISGHTLVIDAMTPERREIQVPQLRRRG